VRCTPMAASTLSISLFLYDRQEVNAYKLHSIGALGFVVSPCPNRNRPGLVAAVSLQP
jgi:hypothetical protein